jgi:hypothetical protein
MSSEKKTVITVDQTTHKQIKVESARRGIPTRQLTSLLLDHGLKQLSAGKITVKDPAIEGGGS